MTFALSKIARSSGLVLVLALIVAPTAYIRLHSIKTPSPEVRKDLCSSESSDGAFRVSYTLDESGGPLSANNDLKIYFQIAREAPSVIMHAVDMTTISARCSYGEVLIVITQLPSRLDQTKAADLKNVKVQFSVDDCLMREDCALKSQILEVNKERARLNQRLISKSDESFSEANFEEAKKEFEAFQLWTRNNHIKAIKY